MWLRNRNIVNLSLRNVEIFLLGFFVVVCLENALSSRVKLRLLSNQGFQRLKSMSSFLER